MVTEWGELADGNGRCSATNQLSSPHGLDIDDDNQSIVIADWRNHRIVEWKIGGTNGTVVADAQGPGSGLHELNNPRDVFIDKETHSFLIGDRWNRRVLQRSRRQGKAQDEVIVDNIDCWD